MKEINAQDFWGNAKGETDSGTVYIRINRGLLPLMESGGFSFEAIFTVPMSETHDIDEELRSLDQIEDLLTPHLERNHETYLALVLTWSDCRDFIFYSMNPDDIIDFFEGTIKKNTHRFIELTINENDWVQYRRFSKAFKK